MPASDIDAVSMSHLLYRKQASRKEGVFRRRISNKSHSDDTLFCAVCLSRIVSEARDHTANTASDDASATRRRLLEAMFCVHRARYVLVATLLLGGAAATLAALLADAGVELGALLPLGGLATLLAYLSVEG